MVTKELKKSGIYVIENVINKKLYIGSSINIYQRLQKHFSLLRHNKHENCYLQNAWNKYGEDNFTFTVLLECNKEELSIQEQYCIDLFQSEYNLTKQVIRNELSPESRLKQSNTRKRLIKEGKLKVNFNPETLYIYDLEGNLLFSNPLGLKDTAKKLNISASSICRVINGTYQQCKGFRFSYKEEKLFKISITNIQQLAKYNKASSAVLQSNL